MNNRERILELKRKNNIKNICKTWADNDIPISIDNFLEVRETLFLQSKILDKLDEMDSKNTSKVYCDKDIDILSIFSDSLISNIDIDREYVFFIKGATKIGALILKGKIIKEKQEFILKESEFFDNGCSIFFVR